MPSGQRLTWKATTTNNNSGSEKVIIISYVYVNIFSIRIGILCYKILMLSRRL